tara:strand:- start:4550 stop:4939 length:390 start_codon:yes stop_codon:yes gene_type:complete
MENIQTNDIEVKKKYIHENIDKIKNHKNYLDIILFHECPHTNNSNGVFINLNSIDESIIDKLYYKLKNELEDDALTENIIEKKIIEEEIENLLKEKDKKVTETIYDKLTLDKFEKEEIEIINLSKKYKI